LSQSVLNRLNLLNLFLAISLLRNSGWYAEISWGLKIGQSRVLYLLVSFLRHRWQLLVSLEPIVLIRVVLIVNRSSIWASFALNIIIVVHRERNRAIFCIPTARVKDVI
jgi:hypothetical protein